MLLYSTYQKYSEILCHIVLRCFILTTSFMIIGYVYIFLYLQNINYVLPRMKICYIPVVVEEEM